MIILIICNSIILCLSIFGFMLAKKMRDEAIEYLEETKYIKKQNNKIIRSMINPINSDGSLNKDYFTNELIEVIDERQADS